jgi:hypothetical protein
MSKRDVAALARDDVSRYDDASLFAELANESKAADNRYAAACAQLDDDIEYEWRVCATPVRRCPSHSFMIPRLKKMIDLVKGEGWISVSSEQLIDRARRDGGGLVTSSGMRRRSEDAAPFVTFLRAFPLDGIVDLLHSSLQLSDADAARYLTKGDVERGLFSALAYIVEVGRDHGTSLSIFLSPSGQASHYTDRLLGYHKFTTLSSHLQKLDVKSLEQMMNAGFRDMTTLVNVNCCIDESFLKSRYDYPTMIARALARDFANIPPQRHEIKKPHGPDGLLVIDASVTIKGYPFVIHTMAQLNVRGVEAGGRDDDGDQPALELDGSSLNAIYTAFAERAGGDHDVTFAADSYFGSFNTLSSMTQPNVYFILRCTSTRIGPARALVFRQRLKQYEFRHFHLPSRNITLLVERIRDRGRGNTAAESYQFTLTNRFCVDVSSATVGSSSSSSSSAVLPSLPAPLANDVASVTLEEPARMTRSATLMPADVLALLYDRNTVQVLESLVVRVDPRLLEKDLTKVQLVSRISGWHENEVEALLGRYREFQKAKKAKKSSAANSSSSSSTEPLPSAAAASSASSADPVPPAVDSVANESVGAPKFESVDALAAADGEAAAVFIRDAPRAQLSALVSKSSWPCDGKFGV